MSFGVQPSTSRTASAPVAADSVDGAFPLSLGACGIAKPSTGATGALTRSHCHLPSPSHTPNFRTFLKLLACDVLPKATCSRCQTPSCIREATPHSFDQTSALVERGQP